jgi:hypothetical protein
MHHAVGAEYIGCMDLYTTLITEEPAPPPSAATVHPDADLAAKLYPELAAKPVDEAPNATVKALRDSEPERAFYRDDQQLGNAPVELARAIAPFASTEVLEANASRLASVMTDVGMSRDDISQLASFAAQAKANPPTHKENAERRRTAMRDLRATYGDSAGDALAAAAQLAQRDPRLARFLDASGLGDHPWVIARMAELARTERNARTLTK